MSIPILFEDEVLVVINKPPGIVVNNAISVKESTVQDWAAEYLHIQAPDTEEIKKVQEQKKLQTKDSFIAPDISYEFKSRAGIVHRIDKETSGILLIAKNETAFGALQEQFKNRTIKKIYVALVHGEVLPVTGEIRAPVGRLPWNKERFGIVPGGKDSVTKYKVLSVIPAPEPGSKGGSWIPGHARNDKGSMLSLVELYPETGRTHQIRVHMKYINHPLLGDYLYAGRVTSRNDREWATRVMLHANKLSCSHPVSGAVLDFEAPIPDDMVKIIQYSNNPILK